MSNANGTTVHSFTPDQGDIVIPVDVTSSFPVTRFNFSQSITNVENTFSANTSYVGADLEGAWVATKGEVFIDEYTINSAGTLIDLNQNIPARYSRAMAGRYAFTSNEEAVQFNWWGVGMWQNGNAPLVKTPTYPEGVLFFGGGGNSRVPAFVVKRVRHKLDVWTTEFIRVQLGGMLLSFDATNEMLTNTTAYTEARARLRGVLQTHKTACDSLDHVEMYNQAINGTTQRSLLLDLHDFASDNTIRSYSDVVHYVRKAQEYQLFCLRLASRPEHMCPMERRSLQSSIFGLDARNGQIVFTEKLASADSYFAPGLATLNMDHTKLIDYKSTWPSIGAQPDLEWIQEYVSDFPGYNADFNVMPVLYNESGKLFIVGQSKLQILIKVELTLDRVPRQLQGVSDMGINTVNFAMPTTVLSMGHTNPTYAVGGVGGSWSSTLHQGAFYGAVTNTQPVPFVIHNRVIPPHVSWVYKVNLTTMSFVWLSTIPRLAHQPPALLANDVVITTDAIGGMHMYKEIDGSFVRTLYVNDTVNYHTDANPPQVLGNTIYWQIAKGWSTPEVLTPEPYNYNNALIASALTPTDKGIIRWKISPP